MSSVPSSADRASSDDDGSAPLSPPLPPRTEPPLPPGGAENPPLPPRTEPPLPPGGAVTATGGQAPLTPPEPDEAPLPESEDGAEGRAADRDGDDDEDRMEPGDRDLGADPLPIDLERPGIVTGRRRRLVVQLLAFVRKELIAVLRQPVLILVLVVGPFLLLFLFAIGYEPEASVLRTTFVGPSDSIYESATSRFGDDLGKYLVDAGYTSDLVEAQQRLEDDEVDLIVIFPDNPSQTVLGGEQAVITVLHNKLDPIQQTAVSVSAQVAVQELNSIILERVVGDLQSDLTPYQEGLDRSSELLDELEQAVADDDQDEIDRITSELDTTSSGLSRVVDSTDAVRTSLGGELTPEEQAQLDALAETAEDFQQTTDNLSSDDELDANDVERAQLALDQVRSEGGTVLTLDPAIAVRPFRTDAESLVREQVTVNDFFAPSAIALLVQHMALTFAALGLVSDKRLGLFELFRVGSVASGRILLGKYLANLILAGAVASVLLAAVVTLVDVPLRGEWWWLAIGIVELVTASIAAGMVLSLLARSDSQAVQFAMLALLAGLFFGGFLLELDAIRYPIKLVSFALPVTFATNLQRDVMLRGVQPDVMDVAGLLALSLVYGSIAWWLMHRRVRLER